MSFPQVSTYFNEFCYFSHEMSIPDFADGTARSRLYICKDGNVISIMYHKNDAVLTDFGNQTTRQHKRDVSKNIAEHCNEIVGFYTVERYS